MMDNHTKASHELSVFDQGIFADSNVLLTICEDSLESQEFLPSVGDPNDLSNILSYRLMDKFRSECEDTKPELDFLQGTSSSDSLKRNCDFFLMKEFPNDTVASIGSQTQTRNVPRLIAPKVSDANCVSSDTRNLVIESYKKRDDKKRATHNEIERRRRDKINNWIYRLRELIPESRGNTTESGLKFKSNVNDSKSQILIRACEYIKDVQEELKSLRECLIENKNLRLSNQQLQLEINQLKTSASQATNVIKLKATTEDNSV